MSSLRLGGLGKIIRHTEEDADDYSCQHIVHDYAPAIGEILDGVDGAGFPDVEETEEGEGGEGPEGPVWDF